MGAWLKLTKSSDRPSVRLEEPWIDLATVYGQGGGLFQGPAADKSVSRHARTARAGDQNASFIPASTPPEPTCSAPGVRMAYHRPRRRRGAGDAETISAGGLTCGHPRGRRGVGGDAVKLSRSSFPHRATISSISPPLAWPVRRPASGAPFAGLATRPRPFSRPPTCKRPSAPHCSSPPRSPTPDCRKVPRQLFNGVRSPDRTPSRSPLRPPRRHSRPSRPPGPMLSKSPRTTAN